MGGPAHRVLGRYQLEEPIACGGMGQVWRGRDLLLGRPVAVKVLRSEYSGDPTFLARFRTEAVHAAALNHPNIAAVYDYGEEPAADGGEQLAYLVMELVEGRPLSSVLEDGPLGTEETLSILRQTAEALAEAHHVGLVHRDVKPGNILLSTDEQVKITDFGIAWSAGSVPLTQVGQVLGTPQYLSPELAVGGAPSPASDVYSLGLVGYECLTGQPAFTGDTPVAVALKQVHEEPAPLPADLPPAVRDLVDVAVAKDPAERMPDGDAFVVAIDRVRDGRPPTTRPPTTVPSTTQPVPSTTQPVPLVARPPADRPDGSPPRRRGLLLAAVLAVLAAGLGVVVGLVGGGGSPAADAPQAVGTIMLDGADYVGRPVDQVAADLAALGLTVRQQAAVTPGAVSGAVTRLSPVGAALQPGDAVTVVFAADEAPGSASDPGAGSASDPAVEPAPAIGGTTPVDTQRQAPVDGAVVPAPVPAAGPSTSSAGAAAAPGESATAVVTPPAGETAVAGTDSAPAPSSDPVDSSSSAPTTETAPSSTQAAPSSTVPEPTTDSSAPAGSSSADPTG